MNLAELTPMNTYYAWSRKRGIVNALPCIVLDNHYWWQADTRYKYDEQGRLISTEAVHTKGRKKVDYIDVDTCGVPVMYGNIVPQTGHIDPHTEWKFALVDPKDILSDWGYASAYQRKEKADREKRNRLYDEKVQLVSARRAVLTNDLSLLGFPLSFSGDTWSNGTETIYGFRLDSPQAEQFIKGIKDFASQELRIRQMEAWQQAHLPLIDMINELGVDELKEYIADMKYELED